MKIATKLSLLGLVSLLCAGPALAAAAVGAPAPDFKLKAADGKEHALSSYKGKVVVLEWLNPNCPFVKRHTKDKTMTTVSGKYRDVVWLGVNSTAANHPDYLAADAIAKWAADNGIAYPILEDADGKIGQAYGARTTPHMFVIGPDGKVVYAGAIDDDPSGKSDAAGRVNYVDQALGAATKGGAIATASTTPYGCSVKYGAK